MQKDEIKTELKSLKEIEKELKQFYYPEEAELTKEEVATLKEMFLVKGSFQALFRYMCQIEGEKGTRMAYSIEDIPTDGSCSAQEVANLVRFRNNVTTFARGKMENLRNTYAKQANDKLTEATKLALDKKEELALKQKEKDAEAKGIADDM